MKFGIIGLGNMGYAILKGFIKNGISPEKIYANSLEEDVLENAKNEYGINISKDYSFIEKIDCLILAVKPNAFKDLLLKISPILEKNNILIVSIAAGLTISKIEEMLKVKTYKPKIIRIMPNINATIGMATSGYCYNSNVSENDLDEIVKAFKSIGDLFYVEEDKFSIFSAIASCSPAYTYLFIDSLAKGAQKLGFNKKEALKIASSAVLGSSSMLLNSDLHPWNLIDNVCSPGGITIEGLSVLEENNFQSSIVKAIEKIVEKDKDLNSK